MGVWKANCTIRLGPETKADLEEFAKREMRTLGNLGEVLLEWSFAQLKAVGLTSRLLKVSFVPRSTKPQD